MIHIQRLWRSHNCENVELQHQFVIISVTKDQIIYPSNCVYMRYYTMQHKTVYTIYVTVAEEKFHAEKLNLLTMNNQYSNLQNKIKLI